MQHQHRAACSGGPHRRRGHTEAAAPHCADLYFSRDFVASGKNLTHRGNQFGLPQRLDKFLSLRASLGQLQNLLECLVAIQNALVAADDGHALHHAAENRRRPVAFVRERTNGLSELRHHATQCIAEVGDFIVRSRTR